MKIGVILRVGQVPLGGKIAKVTAIRSRSSGGPKIYTVRDRLRVFQEDGTRQQILATEGTRFLTHEESGDANAIAGDTEVVWFTDRDTLRSFLSRDPYRDDPDHEDPFDKDPS